jgi:hypothetical protein
MKHLLFCAALCVAAPALAQPAAPASAAAPQAPATSDPGRLALARTTIDFVWPTGTYERMMRGAMSSVIEQMTDSMFDMKIGDLAPGQPPADPKLARQTLREAMAKEDPHFMERMRITNRVMFEEMIPLLNRIEPGIREGLAQVYARKFSAAQLEDLNRFFATPTGRAYAPEAMMAFMEPEIVQQVSSFGPEFVKEMPRIMDKVKAATAHLPPPPARRGEPRRH